MKKELIVNVWDWVVTKDGRIVQIDSDDMQGLHYEDIERHASEEEIKKGIMENVRKIVDRHAGVTGAREVLNKYSPLPTEKRTYSEYTTLKAMEEYATNREQSTDKLELFLEKLKSMKDNSIDLSKTYHDKKERVRFRNYAGALVEAIIQGEQMLKG